MTAAEPMQSIKPSQFWITCGSRGGRRKDGTPCGSPVIAGTERCRMHSGKRGRKAKAEGAVAAELARWGLDGHTTLRDAGEVLLRLVTQSAARVELYARLLGEAYQAAERLAAAHGAERLVVAPDGETAVPEEGEHDWMDPTPPGVQSAKADLKRIFATGGVAALIGVKRDADRFGRVYDTEEAIRGLARLEAEERDRCANFAAKAVAAGLAERQVRLAERQGAQMYAVFARVLERLGLSEEQRAVLSVVLPEEIGALTGAPLTIEGETT